ncbi:MAG: phosphate ABC transporter substrate-binding protein PstS [Firmicutes bacterium]|nr:phosphate ABC transporter substrate-binding protein PstS [Bacillota bacterium]
MNAKPGKGRSSVRYAGLVAGLLAVSLALLAASCGQSDKPVQLNGAGASFPYPLYTKWLAEYKKVRPQVTIDYQSIGSGGGIKGITERTLDFAGSDAPMTDEQLSRAPGAILHIPAVAGAVAVTYNLPELGATLKLTPEILAGIFLGEIKKWNDPRLAEANPGVRLPERDIVVVHRSDGSGTTNIFTDYLSKVSPVWKERVGKGTSVQWPTGVGAKGNEGVAGQVRQTPGSIGYVELAYAIQNRLPYAELRNAAGRFVAPSLETTTAAMAGAAAQMPADMRVSIVNAPGENAYPIAGFTYLLVYKDQQDQAKGKALAEFLWWAIHEGQKHAPELLYAPLPSNVVQLAEAKIKEIIHNGRPFIR